MKKILQRNLINGKKTKKQRYGCLLWAMILAMVRIKQENPCSILIDTAIKIAANNPNQTEPVKAAKAAETKQAANIFPSSPISTIPLLSENNPAIEARMRGTATLVEASKI